MESKVNTVEEYISSLSCENAIVIERLRKMIRENLPDGFIEKIQYDMISYVVSREIYPHGYHCNPEDDLAFISLGAQKNHISLYHMGIYMIEDLKNWFVADTLSI